MTAKIPGKKRVDFLPKIVSKKTPPLASGLSFSSLKSLVKSERKNLSPQKDQNTDLGQKS